MEDKTELMTIDNICNRVYNIRGQQVMLDYDLAEIYGYKVKNLNQQVKRNVTRFPKDFMFQLTRNEMESVKSQFVISRDSNLFEGQGGGRRTLPYAFTEQGIYMLATVLRGELAEQQSIFIMRAFREMRHYIKQNQQFVTQAEMRLVTSRVSEISLQMASMVERQKKTEKNVECIQKSIDAINENFISDKDFKNFVIYKGQKFEADVAYIDIYQKATTSIYVIDDYMNAKTLQLLSQKKQGAFMKYLFTSFKGKNNSSYQLVSQIAGEKMFLTNSFEGLKRDIENCSDTYDMVVMFGLDKNLKNKVRIEKVAEYDGGIETTKLNIEIIKNGLTENEVECLISDTPTKYLCNAAYFHMLKKTDGKAVFVHIPSLKNMSEDMINNIVNSMEKIKDSVV